MILVHALLCVIKHQGVCNASTAELEAEAFAAIWMTQRNFLLLQGKKTLDFRQVTRNVTPYTLSHDLQ